MAKKKSAKAKKTKTSAKAEKKSTPKKKDKSVTPQKPEKKPELILKQETSGTQSATADNTVTPSAEKSPKAKVISLDEITKKVDTAKVKEIAKDVVEKKPTTALEQAMVELNQLSIGLTSAIRNHTGFGNLREHEVLETIRRSHDEEGYKVTFERPIEDALECSVIVEERFTEGAKIRIPAEGFFQISK